MGEHGHKKNLIHLPGSIHTQDAPGSVVCPEPFGLSYKYLT